MKKGIVIGITLGIVAVIAIVLIVVLTQSGGGDPVVGSWVGSNSERLELKSDKTVTLQNGSTVSKGTYVVNNNQVTITLDGREYPVTINNGSFVLNNITYIKLVDVKGAASTMVGVWKCNNVNDFANALLKVFDLDGLLTIDVSAEFKSDNTFEITFDAYLGGIISVPVCSDTPIYTGRYTYTNGNLILNGENDYKTTVKGNSFKITIPDSNGLTYVMEFVKQ